MMGLDPGESVFNGGDGRPGRNRGTPNHMDFDTEQARSFDLGIGCAAAGILGEHAADVVLPEKFEIVFGAEWAARRDDRRLGKAWGRFARVDDADDVAMLGRGAERGDRLAAETGENVLRRGWQSRDCGIDAIELAPFVADGRRPLRPLDREQRNVSGGAGRDGVVADAGRKRMRGIDDEIDGLASQIFGKPVNAAEAADANGEKARSGIGRAPSER